MVNGVNSFNNQQFKKVVKSAFGVDLIASEPWLEPVMEISVAANVSLIRSIGTQLSDQVEQMVLSAYNGGTRVEDLADHIFGRFDVAESRANLIARDQTSKLNGKLTQFRQTNIGVEKYIWRTSLDERVRETHADHEGETYAWDAGPEDTGNPGDDIQCRCYGEMVVPDNLAPGLDDAQSVELTEQWRKEQEDDA